MKKVKEKFSIINSTIDENLKLEKRQNRMHGNLGVAPDFDNLIKNLYRCLDTISPKSIVEIGFNAGHSAIMFLEYSNDITVHSYDICARKYTQPCASKVKQEYKDRFEFTKADSTKLQSVTSADMILIDGNHTYSFVKNDIKLAINSGIEYILLDDMQNQDVQRAAAEYNLTELYSFEYSDAFVKTDSRYNQNRLTLFKHV